MHRPADVTGVVAALREVVAAGQVVEPVGGGTKRDWGGRIPATAAGVAELRTGGLGRIREHNAGDFTAVLEAGVPLAVAQERFAEAGQWLALDPPLGAGDAATIGGVVATADCGPARHRHGGARDLVIGMTVVLSDGTVAKSGGRVIKNVAGYDVGKLFTGSFGTLGLIAEVAVRLHPLPRQTATVTGVTDDPERLRQLVLDLARRPLEAAAFDVAWSARAGRVLVRFAGATAARQARAAAPLLSVEQVEVVEDDAATWARQRAAQRAPEGAVLKVSARPTDLASVVRAADEAGAALVGRAALGLSWLAFAPGADLAQRVERVRRALAPRACSVLDGGARLDAPWAEVAPGALAVMGRLKSRFDPERRFRPGAFVGGL